MFSVANIFPSMIGIFELDSKWLTVAQEFQNVKLKGEDYQGQRQQYGDVSESTYVLDTEEFLEFKKELTHHTNYFLTDVLCKKQSNLKITQSWISVKRQGQYHETHRHPNSIVSGVYYWQDGVMPIVFEKDYMSDLHIDDDWDKMKENPQAYNKQYVPVAKNTLLLFQSSMKHGVEPNTSNEDRYSLAFNTFPTLLGNEQTLTELNIDNLK